MKISRKKLAFLLGTVVSLVAMFALAGIAVAQVDGVDNEVETCVGESCNSGNVAEVEVEGGGLGVFLNVGVIVGDSNLTVNDAFNTDVNITQIQEGGPADPIVVPDIPAVGGVGNEVETCVGGSCNSGNVAEVKVDNGLEISISLELLGLILDLPIGDFAAQQDLIDGLLLEIDLPCTIVAINLDVIDGNSDLTANDVCNTGVSITQSQS